MQRYVVIAIHVLCIVSSVNTGRTIYDQKLLGCQELGLQDQTMCSVVGGTSGQVKYDPIKWLATRESVVSRHTDAQTSDKFSKIAAPDISITRLEKAGNIVIGKKVTVRTEADVLWCSDIHCSSMLDLIFDKDANKKFSALLQMQIGSYFGVSAAGRYDNGRLHRPAACHGSSEEEDGHICYYEATRPYSKYYAVDALIATNSVMRSFVATHLQGSYGVKVKFSYEKEINNDCIRFIYSGNPCTGYPDISGPECSTPVGTVVILPNHLTKAAEYYGKAVAKAAKEVEESCTNLAHCSLLNISSCLSSIPELCNRDIHKSARVWTVPMLDSSGKRLGSGVALSLKDNLWSFKTSDKKQHAWLEDKKKTAERLAFHTSRIASVGSTYSGIEPFDIIGFDVLHALRNYPSYCTNRSTDILGELNYLGTYVNCSYTTNDDTYEGLLGTSSEDGYCVSSDNPKYEYYSSPDLVKEQRAFKLYDGMSAYVVSNTTRCIRLNGNPPSRYCPPEGDQYLKQIHSYYKQVLQQTLSSHMASTVATMTIPGYVVSFIAMSMGIIGAAVAVRLSCTADITNLPDEHPPYATSLRNGDCEDCASGSGEAQRSPLLAGRKNAPTATSRHSYGKIGAVLSALLLFVSAILAMSIFTIVEYQSERDNAGKPFFSMSGFDKKAIVKQYITADAVKNDRYDSGYLYLLSETTVSVDTLPMKCIGILVCIVFVILTIILSLYCSCKRLRIRRQTNSQKLEELGVQMTKLREMVESRGLVPSASVSAAAVGEDEAV